MKTFLRWVSAFLTPVPLAGLAGLPRYLIQWRRLKSLKPSDFRVRDSYPCLADWVQSTPFDPHYFYQSAWLARQIAQVRPGRHTDIGSDVRMIGVLSAFVDVSFVDFRPLRTRLEGLQCIAGNLTALEFVSGSLESLSCLHVIEHVGLGRYGDPLDIAGSVRALSELQRVLAPGGRLYISVPIGRERVCFNAHRVFSPRTIVDALPELSLLKMSAVDDQGEYIDVRDIDSCNGFEYGCGMFVFAKN